MELTNKKPHILVIYTGGTIGMVEETGSRVLRPFDFTHLTRQIPELNKLDYVIDTIALDNPVDSSNMNPVIWLGLARIIEENYADYDGFVVLHGSDTMSYTASALSFILENLDKPVILTGSQLPIGVIRTDGKENFLTAVEIAGARDEEDRPLVPEVCIYFEYKLYRGNRSHKYSAENFQAFNSPNYPILAEAGVSIKYYKENIAGYNVEDLVVNNVFNSDVTVLHIFPGLNEEVVRCILLNENVRGVILHTYGAGNAPTFPWFIDLLKEAVDQGKLLYNVSQCQTGSVDQTRYETGKALKDLGVVSGKDITLEAAITKMMYLLGHNLDDEEITYYLSNPLRGEMMSGAYYL
ncbi:MAG: asparaginase [Salibacter sp.]|uniref:asparaginase n=1 Tax=Salibacter sp. TaxID=2010995 RepID=UPI002870A2CD|nr:asparaginase [Salibacter sp.]MDR9399188.1 asparaginase [Salibacter sp.]